MKIEICCGSYQDALRADAAGAVRIELNQALSLGGLTPSVASLKMVKRETDLEVICMVRCRGAGFYYSEVEYGQMKEELLDLLKNGADGIAFGFLTEKHQIDVERTREFLAIIRQHGATAVFHRAIDCVDDYFEGLEILNEMGIDRVLTSGQKATAEAGLSNIRRAHVLFGNRMEILPGAGISTENIRAFSFCGQAHSSAKTFHEDPTTISKNGRVHYSIMEGTCKHQVVDQSKVSELRNEFDY